MIDRSRIRPSLWWLALAALPAIAGIAVAVILFVVTVRDATGPFVSLDRPVTVRLDQDDGRGIWARTRAEVTGSCRAEGPVAVRMQRTTGVTLQSGAREYHSFLRFEAPRTGTYRVACTADQPLALGPRVTGLDILAGVGGILGALLGALVLSAGIVAAVLLLRDRSKRRLELEARGGLPPA